MKRFSRIDLDFRLDLLGAALAIFAAPAIINAIINL